MAIPDTVYVQVKVGEVPAPYVTSIQFKSKVNSVIIVAS